jgi:uncharacterized membrane protein
MSATIERGFGARISAVARQLPDQVAITTLALVGIAISVYLTVEHYAKIPLFCSTTGVINCASVLTSQYSVVPGTKIPITIPGLLWFVISGTLAMWGLISVWRGQSEPSWLRQTQQGWGALGLLTVLYLVSVEIDQVHHLCEWCTVVHLAVLATFLISLYFRDLGGKWAHSTRSRVSPARAASTQRAKTAR